MPIISEDHAQDTKDLLSRVQQAGGQTEEPGFLQPGSGSEAALRGFANGATLGLGKYANALAERTGLPQAAAELIGGSTTPGENRLLSAWPN